MSSKKPTSILGIIPARYQSRRFPGKLLAPLNGTTLLHQTYTNAQKAVLLDHLLIATDDSRIAAHAASFGAPCLLTPSCPTGTDRAAWVIQQMEEEERPAIVVNIQGDEPALAPTVIDQVIQALQQDPTLPIATAAAPLLSIESRDDPSIVKCVRNLQGEALYFSRARIPHGHTSSAQGGDSPLHHIGIYAYRTPFLLTYATLPVTPLQKAEDLEQLKILEHGYRMHIVLVHEQPPGVDTPQDLAAMEKHLCRQSTSSSPGASARPLAKG